MTPRIILLSKMYQNSVETKMAIYYANLQINLTLSMTFYRFLALNYKII